LQLERFRNKQKSIKGSTAPAGILRVGITDFKTLSVKPVVEMNLRTLKICKTDGVDKNLDAVGFNNFIIRFAIRKTHGIFHAGTTASFHADAHELVLGSILALQIPNFVGCTFSKCYHSANPVRYPLNGKPVKWVTSGIGNDN
jgi:hypothetical protein